MDIFMMSSSFEGLPIALLEAMSMECAIVSTDAGGIKEVIRDNVDGKICKVDDWKNLAKMKEAARERVIKEFSLSQMVQSLENIYTEFANVEREIKIDNAD